MGLPVPVGKTVSYEDPFDTGISFDHPNDWEISPYTDESGASNYVFKFDKFPRYVVDRGKKTLWKATACRLVVFPPNGDTTTVKATQRLTQLAVKLLPKNRSPNVPIFSDVSFDSEDYPRIVSRTQADFSVPVTVRRTTYSTYGGSWSSTHDSAVAWLGYGQILKLDDRAAMLFCHGETRYRNQFAALADSLAETLKAE